MPTAEANQYLKWWSDPRPTNSMSLSKLIECWFQRTSKFQGIPSVGWTISNRWWGTPWMQNRQCGKQIKTQTIVTLWKQMVAIRFKTMKSEWRLWQKLEIYWFVSSIFIVNLLEIHSSYGRGAVNRAHEHLTFCHGGLCTADVQPLVHLQLGHA